MRVAHVLNMANDAWPLVKEMRRRGVEADLIIDEKDFGMGLPMWEEADVEGDPYSFDFKSASKLWEPPPWVRVWGCKYRYSPNKVSNLFRMCRGYDLLHCHATSSGYLQFSGTKYLVYEAGWIRKLVSDPEDDNWVRLGRRAYKNAACITYTNPDTVNMVKSLNPRRLDFLPFAIDTDKYKPPKVNPSRDSLLFFHPTRQVWDVKGNDRLLRAFAKFIYAGGDAHLICVDWGWQEDVENAKKLIESLGVASKVTWVPPMNKLRLIKAIGESDAVFDQFLIGGTGTLGLEAMACERPLCIYMAHWTADAFGEKPPVVNASTEEQILSAMLKLGDRRYRERIGVRGREWVKRHCDPGKVVDRLLSIYEEVEV